MVSNTGFFALAACLLLFSSNAFATNPSRTSSRATTSSPFGTYEVYITKNMDKVDIRDLKHVTHMGTKVSGVFYEIPYGGVQIKAEVPKKARQDFKLIVPGGTCDSLKQVTLLKMDRSGKLKGFSNKNYKVARSNGECVLVIQLRDGGNHDLSPTKGLIRARLFFGFKEDEDSSSTTTRRTTTRRTTTRRTTTRRTTTSSTSSSSSSSSSSSTTASTTTSAASTTTTTNAAGLNAVDTAILNFALNLEYLEAEFYLAAVGRLPSYEDDVSGEVTGRDMAVDFETPEFREYLMEVADDEENHVVFLRSVLGDLAVDRPDINIAGGPDGAFGIAAAAAGTEAGLNNDTITALSTFSPYANEIFFLHGAFIFEDVGVTAYKGAAPLVTNKDILEAAAGILAVEAYHAAEIRTILYQLRNTVAIPAGAVGDSMELRVQDIVGAISGLRGILDGSGDDGHDQSILLDGIANIVPADENSLAFSRSPRQVLNIVYGAANANQGLFFPNGLNGDFSALLGNNEGPQAQGFVLSDDGDTLLSVDYSDFSSIESVSLARTLRAIAYRPVTGDFLGFADGKIYRVNTATGALTDLGASFASNAQIDADAAVDMDFNNQIDAMRIISTDGDNLVYFPAGFGGDNDNAVVRFTSLAYADDDTNADETPLIFGNAYTNAIEGMTASSTQQYALDAATDSLVTLANNAGTLSTVGPLTLDGSPVNVSPLGGFDIVSKAEGENVASVILTLEDASDAFVYSLDLTNGNLMQLSSVPEGSFGLALRASESD